MVSLEVKRDEVNKLELCFKSEFLNLTDLELTKNQSNSTSNSGSDSIKTNSLSSTSRV